MEDEMTRRDWRKEIQVLKEQLLDMTLQRDTALYRVKELSGQISAAKESLEFVRRHLDE